MRTALLSLLAGLLIAGEPGPCETSRVDELVDAARLQLASVTENPVVGMYGDAGAAADRAAELAAGPSFGHAMTKRMLHQEWSMGVDEAIESEAQAQAICMMTQDFHRAYHAFVAKQKPAFEGD